MTLKFEVGVPIPPGKGTGMRAALRELAKQPIGTSVMLVGVDSLNLRRAIPHVSKETGARFASRMVEGGSRAWRVA